MVHETPVELSPYRMSLQLKIALFVLTALGVISMHLMFMQDSTRAWYNFLLGSCLFLGFGLFGLFFTSIQHITIARWSVSTRRIMEAMALSLIVAALLFLIIAGKGVHAIYEWANAETVAKDTVLQWKAGFLNEHGFQKRVFVYFAIWLLSAWVLVRNSLRQDRTNDPALSNSNRRWSGLILVIFALSVSMAGFEFLMSIEPHWFSTIFGVYFFSGFFQAGLAMMYILAYLLYRSGTLKDVMNIDHFHDIARFIFAFSIFWAYIGFCQFLLIWYGDLPEEIFFFKFRMENGWEWVSLLLLCVRFVAPFLILMPYGAKRNFKVVLGISALILFGQWLDLAWIIKPAMRLPLDVAHVLPSFDWKEVAVGIGFLSLFMLVVGFIMEKMRMIPVKDPRLEASIHYYHH